MMRNGFGRPRPIKAMRKPSEMFLNIKPNIDGAQESLRAMSQLADSWKKFNEKAANRLQSSLNLRHQLAKLHCPLLNGQNAT
jgi:hypothetical protein